MRGGGPLQLFITNKTHPLSTLLFPLVQMPVFVSFFFALRAMAAAPVASMQTEGAPPRRPARTRSPSSAVA
jgi:membrane protein insertase Oxa1/YidC/SpoIIIJ